MDNNSRLYSALATFAVFLAGQVWLLIDARALRDVSSAPKKPFSLARVQLWWWTLVILGCYILVYGFTGTFWPLNETAAVLLGISAATTTAGRIIDNRDESTATLSIDPTSDASSKGFLADVLSDGNGISMHRFQTLAFNLAYGLHFVVATFTDVVNKTPNAGFPNFSEGTLSLLGISSATYAAMKANEAIKPAASTVTAVATTLIAAAPPAVLTTVLTPGNEAPRAANDAPPTSTSFSVPTAVPSVSTPDQNSDELLDPLDSTSAAELH